MMCPENSGTLFHNYKGYFSLQFLGVSDARYCFISIDLGQYGSNNDTGILNNSEVGKAFAVDTMNIPEPSAVEGCEFDPLPYYMFGDAIFHLQMWLWGFSSALENIINVNQNSC